MQIRKAALVSLVIFLARNTLGSQQPPSIANDPAPDAKVSAQNVKIVLSSHDSRLTGLFLLASGAQRHGMVILLHGFPGYEQNMDLAQALRRDGWNVLAMHYRGTWGAEGTFSFTHCMEDAGAMVAYVTDPANATRFHVDTRRIVVVGHSMGGFMAAATMAHHAEIVAGVVMTEGSPVHDGVSFYGALSDPVDYVPLAGTSPAALKQEAKANAAAWAFPALAATIAPRPVLVLSTNDGLRASNETLAAALTHAGSPVSYIHMDTDHVFSDHRIALESTVIEWLDKTVRR
jgi:pimeloyl-ACP methyl ester carboxylesterase